MIREQKGFSLVEVLMGVILLAVGLLALAGLQIASTTGSFKSNNLMQASYIAQDSLETLRSLVSNSDNQIEQNLYNTLLQPGEYTNNKAAGSVAVSGVVYKRRYTVTDDDGVRVITYVVTWRDNADHSVTYVTRRSQ